MQNMRNMLPRVHCACRKRYFQFYINLSLTKRNALTTEPRIQIWHVKMRAIVVVKSNCKMHVEQQFGSSPTLVLSPTTKIWLGNSNEMCLQGLNLSSTRNSAFHHDLAWLQQAMNAVGVCFPQKWNMNTQEWLILRSFVVDGLVIIHYIYANWRIHVIQTFQCLSSSKRSSLKIDLYLGVAHRRRISAEHQMFYGKWLDNHPFYPFSLKDLCARAFWASLSLQTLPRLKSTTS